MMHFLIGAAALLYIVTTLARLISQWRSRRAALAYDRRIRDLLTPLPRVAARPAPEPIFFRSDTRTGVALAGFGVFWLCVLGVAFWGVVFR
jgi:hypothetical protein